jgi:hypothetical protein
LLNPNTVTLGSDRYHHGIIPYIAISTYYRYNTYSILLDIKKINPLIESSANIPIASFRSYTNPNTLLNPVDIYQLYPFGHIPIQTPS